MRACHSQYYYWGSVCPFGGTPRRCRASRFLTPASMNCHSWISESPQESSSQRSPMIAPSCSHVRLGELSRTPVSDNETCKIKRRPITTNRYTWYNMKDVVKLCDPNYWGGEETSRIRMMLLRTTLLFPENGTKGRSIRHKKNLYIYGYRIYNWHWPGCTHRTIIRSNKDLWPICCLCRWITDYLKTGSVNNLESWRQSA